MSTYGLSDTGFRAATVEEILEKVQAEELSLIDPALDLDPDTQIGQINGIFASKLAEAWEILGTLASSFDDESAEESLLDVLCALTGTRRRQDTKGIAIVTCTLTAGTIMPGTARVSNADDDSQLWEIHPDFAGFTATVDSTYDIKFLCVLPGVFLATPGKLTVIDTPVSGWSVATNAHDAEPGALRMRDTELRIVRREELADLGTSSTAALRAALLKITGVVSAHVIENTKSYPVNGQPGHSIRAVIWDGVTPEADNDEIRTAIYNNTAAGIRSFGNIYGDVTDEFGEAHTVFFDRSIQIEITITVVVWVVLGKYAGNTAVKAAIVAAGLLYDEGQDARSQAIKAVCMGVPGVVDIGSCLLSSATISPGDYNIPIGALEIATFDTSRITVTYVEVIP